MVTLRKNEQATVSVANMNAASAEKPKSAARRGFAAMNPDKQRSIASMGGKAAHAKGTAHQFTSEEARIAGRKGGKSVSRDRAHMSAIGRKGGSRSRAMSTGGSAN